MSRIVIFAFLSLILWPAAEGMNMVHAEDAHRGEYPGDVKVELRDDVAQRVLTIRIGPIDLPAHAHHMLLPEQFMTIPFDGWFTAYRPRLLDERERPLLGKLLHHLQFYDTTRRDLICDKSEAYIFGAGAEMTVWPAQSGRGYRVGKGSRIRIWTMLHNPSETSFRRVYLEVRANYRLITDRPALRNVYVARFYVGDCPMQPDATSHMFDLKPGKSVVTQQWTIDYPGKLLGLGGHLHDFGREVRLENVPRNEVIATLKPILFPKGILLKLPIVSLETSGGYQLNRGDIVRVTGIYDNSSGKRLPMAGMAIVAGTFLPDNDEELAAAKRIR